MPTTKKEVVPQDTLVKQRAEGLALVAPLKPKVNAMVIETEDQYLAADEVLYSIRHAKKAWEDKLDPIIKPARQSLDLLYGLRKNIVDSFEMLEGQVKERMRAFKIREARLLQEAREQQEREAAELQRKIEEKERAETKAKTPAMVTRIAESKAILQQALASKQATVIEEVKASSSQARKLKKWQVTDMQAFLKYLIEKKPDLLSLVEISNPQMNALYKLQKPEIGKWMPGVEIVEDISIAGRR